MIKLLVSIGKSNNKFDVVFISISECINLGNLSYYQVRQVFFFVKIWFQIWACILFQLFPVQFYHFIVQLLIITIFDSHHLYVRVAFLEFTNEVATWYERNVQARIFVLQNGYGFQHGNYASRQNPRIDLNCRILWITIHSVHENLNKLYEIKSFTAFLNLNHIYL